MLRMLNIARLVSTCGEIEGRKKLQKIVHLLREAGFHEDFCYRFGYLHYGPYSHELRDEIDALAADGTLVNESEHQKGEYPTFVYSPANDLGQLLEDMELSCPPAWSSLAQDLNSRSAQDLEAISTVVYLRRLGHSGEELLAKFRALKPSLVDRLDEAVSEARRLVSVSIS